MCFKTYILKRVVNNKQLKITRSFDLDNLICTVTEILEENKIDLIITDKKTRLFGEMKKSPF
ncbi:MULTISPECIES: hypothetical protein [unclassified Clostridioides]|uniref:hypothetical protein n=1 Tax=unclassified Clostridioides TaxID=2635829 RepID=UPI000AB91E63|nr:hypothetical protein [Clostridioides difficile]